MTSLGALGRFERSGKVVRFRHPPTHTTEDANPSLGSPAAWQPEVSVLCRVPRCTRGRNEVLAEPAQRCVEEAVPFHVTGVKQQSPAPGFEGLRQGPCLRPRGGFGLANYPLVGLDGGRHQAPYAGLGEGIGELREALNEDRHGSGIVARLVHEVIHHVGYLVGTYQARLQMFREATVDRREPM